LRELFLAEIYMPDGEQTAFLRMKYLANCMAACFGGSKEAVDNMKQIADFLVDYIG